MSPPRCWSLVACLAVGGIRVCVRQRLPATPAINDPAFDLPVNATRHPITVGGGHRAYGAFFETGMGYRAQNTTKVALGNAPETIYMVTSGVFYILPSCLRLDMRRIPGH